MAFTTGWVIESVWFTVIGTPAGEEATLRSFASVSSFTVRVVVRPPESVTLMMISR